MGRLGADIVDASASIWSVIAEDARSFIRSTERVADELILDRSWTQKIWLPSFVSLGAVDLALTSRVVTRSVKGLEVVGGVAGVGLIAASTLDLWHAESPEQQLDAGSDLMWGAQGLSYVVLSPSIATLATGFGFVGAVAQISSGALRVARGIRRRDAETVKLGALDLGGGALWAGWDIAGWGNPLFLASYVLLMVGREAYANKDAVRQWFAERGIALSEA